jgi:uncharacterized protein (TIGR02246 family)
MTVERDGAAPVTVPGAVAADSAARRLYRALLDGWNSDDAAAMAAVFAEDGEVIGFDGSTSTGRADIARSLGEVFAHHRTANFVVKVRTVRPLGADAAVLRADAGMVPPGGCHIDPQVTAVQTLVVTRAGESWRVALFQNTPAQLHGRPEEARRLTEELQQVADATLGGH